MEEKFDPDKWNPDTIKKEYEILFDFYNQIRNTLPQGKKTPAESMIPDFPLKPAKPKNLSQIIKMQV